MWKKILLVQICVSLFFTSMYIAAGWSESELMKEKRGKLIEAMSTHYTAEDIIEKSKKAAEVIVKAPAVMTGYILSSNEQQLYGEPIDRADEGKTTSIYAVAGGQVIETGENDDLGKYIKIRHDGAVSVYGHCSNIYVKAGEHVRQGHVIGSFKQRKSNEFYYDLIEE